MFAGMTKSNVNKLQRVQNTLARVVLRRGKFDHITLALQELHWLPVEHRVSYKLASLAHRPTVELLVNLHTSVNYCRIMNLHALCVLPPDIYSRKLLLKLFLPPGVSDILLLLSGTVYRTLFAVVLILTVLSVILKLTYLI